MSKTATIRTRIEPGLKSEVEDILAQLGLTASETVHLLYRQIKLQRGLPFDVRIPNALTTRTLNASKMKKNIKRFGSKRELFADLGLSELSAAPASSRKMSNALTNVAKTSRNCGKSWNY